LLLVEMTLQIAIQTARDRAPQSPSLGAGEPPSASAEGDAPCGSRRAPTLTRRRVGLAVTVGPLAALSLLNVSPSSAHAGPLVTVPPPSEAPLAQSGRGPNIQNGANQNDVSGPNGEWDANGDEAGWQRPEPGQAPPPAPAPPSEATAPPPTVASAQTAEHHDAPPPPMVDNAQAAEPVAFEPPPVADVAQNAEGDRAAAADPAAQATSAPALEAPPPSGGPAASGPLTDPDGPGPLPDPDGGPAIDPDGDGPAPDPDGGPALQAPPREFAGNPYPFVDPDGPQGPALPYPKPGTDPDGAGPIQPAPAPDQPTPGGGPAATGPLPDPDGPGSAIDPDGGPARDPDGDGPAPDPDGGPALQAPAAAHAGDPYPYSDPDGPQGPAPAIPAPGADPDGSGPIAPALPPPLPDAGDPEVQAISDGDPAAWGNLPDGVRDLTHLKRGEAHETTVANAQALVFAKRYPNRVAPDVVAHDCEGQTICGSDAPMGAPVRDQEPALEAARAAADPIKALNASRLRDSDPTLSRTEATVASEWLEQGLGAGDRSAFASLSPQAREAASCGRCDGPLTPEQVAAAMNGMRGGRVQTGLAQSDEDLARTQDALPIEPANAYEAEVYRQAKQQHDAQKPDAVPGYRGPATPELTLGDFRKRVNEGDAFAPITEQTSQHALRQAMWGDLTGSSPPPALSPYAQLAAAEIEPGTRTKAIDPGATLRTQARALALQEHGRQVTNDELLGAAARLYAANPVRFGDAKTVDLDAPLDRSRPLVVPAAESEWAGYRQARLDVAAHDSAGELRNRAAFIAEDRSGMPADPPQDSPEPLLYRRVGPEGSDQAVPATAEQRDWVLRHRGEMAAHAQFVEPTFKRVVPDSQRTIDTSSWERDHTVEVAHATLDEYLAAVEREGKEAADQQFYRDPAPSPPAPDDWWHEALDWGRRLAANANQGWKLAWSPAVDPAASGAERNIAQGLGRLPEIVVGSVDAAVVELQSLDDESATSQVFGVPPEPRGLTHLDGTPVDDAAKRAGETDLEAYARTFPVSGGFAHAVVHQSELYKPIVTDGDFAPAIDAWSNRPFDTGLEVLSIAGPAKGLKAMVVRRMPAPGAIEARRTVTKPATRAPADRAAAFLTDHPKLAPESLPQLTRIFTDTGSGGRGVSTRPGEHLRSRTSGAATELRRIHELSARPDVVRIELVPPTNIKGERRPDAIVHVRQPDNSIRLVRDEHKTLTGTGPGYLPNGAPPRLKDGTARDRVSTVDEIVAAVRKNVRSTPARNSQLDVPMQGVAPGGTLALKVRGGSARGTDGAARAMEMQRVRDRVAQAIKRLDGTLPQHVEAVEFLVHGMPPIRYANPDYVAAQP
jgi:hypothetical protein